MIKIYMNNVKSKIDNINLLDYEILNELCYTCSYQKIGFNKEPRQFLINLNNGMLYTGLIPYVIQIFKKYNIQYQLIDIRKKVNKIYNWNIVNGYILRDYQQKIIDIANKHSRRVFLACTSCGKSFIISNIIKEKGVKTLIIVPQISLSIQLKRDIEEALGITVGVINGNIINKNFPIIVATPQSVLNYPDVLEEAQMLICDECHTVPSDTIYKVCCKCKNAYYRYALSGSCWRDDGTDLLLTSAFTVRNPQDSIMASELIRKGILTPVQITYFKCPEIYIDSHNYENIYQTNIINNEQRNNKVITLAKEHFYKNDAILILFKNIQHGHILYQKALQQIENKEFIYIYKNQKYKFHTIELVDGNTDIYIREAIFQAIKDGLIKIMIASSVADMGLNIPILSVLILAGGGKSSTSAFQRVGRVIRSYKNKKQAYVYDFFDMNNTLYQHSQIRYELMKLEPEFKQYIKSI